MESKGLFLFIWGKPQYGFMAYQLAMSIKYYSPSIPIHLCTDQIAVSRLQHLQFFDTIEYVDTPQDPAQAKISMYDRLPFDHTIFLDADGLCVGEMESVFEQLMADEKPFRCFVYAYYNQNDKPDLPLMVWARRDVIWEHYNFNGETMPATQSSMLYIRKGEFCEKLYQKMQANYANRIPLEKLKNKWGGGQPDELYLNITLAQLGYDPSFKNIIYFADDLTLKAHQIKDKYKILSLFGTANNVRPPFERFYDSSVKNLAAHFGVRQTFQWKGVKSSKHANIRNVMNKRQAFQGGFVRSEKLPHEPIKKTGRLLLFTSYFDSGHEGRQRELNACLENNKANKNIDHIYIYSESDKIQSDGKVTVRFQGRPTYRSLINWANDLAKPEDVVVIANSDIYFDDTILWPFAVPMGKTMIALSRWDIHTGGNRKLFAYEHSQDTWIFRGKIDIEGGDYHMGLPGCDNRIAYDANKSGYKVVNPAKDILTYHLHLTNVRSYTQADRTEGGYLPVFITSIRDIKAQTVLINQPGKVGDILIVLPIAKAYADQGYTVSWNCPPQYHSMFQYVDYVKPVTTATGDYSKIIDLSFGLVTNTVTHNKWLKWKTGGGSFVEYKYQLADIPVSERYNLKYNRNEQKEDALFAALGLNGDEPYVLFHPASDYGDPVDSPRSNISNIVLFRPVENYTVFDWRKVIERAAEIHCIDSCLANFVEVLQPDVPKFFYRIPQRTTESLFNFNNWKIIE